MTFLKDRVTPENLGSLLGQHLAPGDLLIDLAWNIDCREIVQWCHDHGVLYVSNLGHFDPDQLNTQDVFQITPSGQLKVVATGLSKVLGLAFDGRARLYVLETSHSAISPEPVPATGRLIRILPNGQQQILINSTPDDPLVFPTGLTFGPDGSLYISNHGFGPPGGEILKVEVND